METGGVTGSEIKIIGTELFKRAVTNALVLLKAKAPESYQIAINNIGIIKQSEHSGMLTDQIPPIFELNDRSAFYSLTWCAGIIAHDSFHSYLYHDYKKVHSGIVPRYAWTGYAAEIKCLIHQARVLEAIGAPDNEISHCKNIPVFYSDADNKERNW
jgi:hypothetical protein